MPCRRPPTQPPPHAGGGVKNPTIQDRMQAEATGDLAPSLRQAMSAPGVRRSLLALFLAQAASTSALTTSVSLSSILVTQITGSAALSGLPATLNTAAAAGSAYLAGIAMGRFGCRAGLLSGYLLGAFGAAVGCLFAKLMMGKTPDNIRTIRPL